MEVINNTVLEHVKLAKEYGLLPVNADSEEDYKPVANRKKWILKRIEELKKIEGGWVDGTS